MSAFMVDKVHIDVMVSIGLRGVHGQAVSPDTAWHGINWFAEDPTNLETWAMVEACRRTLNYETADEVGAMLIAANLESIHARYPDTVGDPEATPGPLEQYWLSEYRWADPRCRVSAVEALKAIACFEYQSCEHEGWRGSEARAFCDALRQAVIAHLPGISEAPWEWRPEHLAERRGARLTR